MDLSCIKEYNDFCLEHRNCHINSPIGGKFSIITTPTSIGIFTKVKCNVCGEERSINNIESL